MKYIEGFRGGDAGRYLGERIAALGRELSESGQSINVMEVCGSHTMAISRYGIRGILPESIKLLSGPGCPVCVTDTGYVDAAIEIAHKGHIIVTFGDMVRVPGTGATLADARSEGADVRVCYTPTQAMEIALGNRDREVIFLAIGFETTLAPLVALVDRAQRRGLDNLSLLVAFKTVPPALDALVSDPEVNVQAFLCPAHVSAIIGAEAYRPYVERNGVPCVVCGFEPLDILLGIEEVGRQAVAGEARLVNQYSRVVKAFGNKVAQAVMDKYLEPVDVNWRGIGVIPKSGLGLRAEYQMFDAAKKFKVSMDGGTPDPSCRCGEVLKGKIVPSECGRFAGTCTPTNPVGPCMVSSEGSCAAWFKYERGGNG